MTNLSLEDDRSKLLSIAVTGTSENASLGQYGSGVVPQCGFIPSVASYTPALKGGTRVPKHVQNCVFGNL